MNKWIGQWVTAIPFPIPTSSSKYPHLPSMNEMCTYVSLISAHKGGLWSHFLWWLPYNLCITSSPFKKRRYTSFIFSLCITWTNKILCSIGFSLLLKQVIMNLLASVQSLSCVQLFATHGLQHARLPCLSPTPGAWSNSCPWSRWCHPTISSSIAPFSSFLQSVPASGSFQMSQFFTLGGQSIEVSASSACWT